MKIVFISDNINSDIKIIFIGENLYMDYIQRIKNSKRIVVKIGTTSLTYSNGKLNLKRIEKLARVLVDLSNQEKEIILVSSGAIAVGAARLGLSERPRDIKGKQASSAVGQAVLMQIYEKFFMEYNQKVAQILLTKDIFDYDKKRNNAKNTLFKLWELGVIPIVNANDTIATDELNMEISDNDTLSAYVAVLSQSDLLIILSDIDGMYDKDPNTNKDANIIKVVEKIDDSIYSIAGGAGSSLGTGGMITKVKAAKTVNDKGIDLIIASGEEPSILFDIFEGKSVGTLFLSEKRKV